MIQCRITDAFTRRILPLSVAAPRHNIIISHTRSLCALHSAAATGCREVELRVRACRFRTPIAGVAELADALDSKSSGRKVVWVRAPPPATILYLRRIFSIRRQSLYRLDSSGKKRFQTNSYGSPALLAGYFFRTSSSVIKDPS